jgi:Tol biopolymer transport system component/DNA-binding winged helix-turn-helix (wHTH) protein
VRRGNPLSLSLRFRPVVKSLGPREFPMGERPSVTNGSPPPGVTNASVRFGSFEVDLRAGEIRKSGVKIKLQGQPLEVLALLLERPGQVVTREELQQKLWAGDTFVDFEHGLNKAISKVREALADEADNPRFIETLPRRGYRFIAPVEGREALGTPEKRQRPSVLSAEAVASETRREPRIRRSLLRYSILLATAVLLSGATFLVVGYLMRSRPHNSNTLTVVPFTTYPGFEATPSFSPDGNQIAFGWSKEGLNFDVYVKQIGQERAVQLTHRPATFVVPAWSPDGRFIAFARAGKDDNETGIYLLPALGGSERKLAEATTAGYAECWAQYLLSWSPDGKLLAFSKDDAPTAKADNTSPRHAYIHLLNMETFKQRALPDPSPDCDLSFEPAFSPDGKYLASVCVLSAGVNKIFVQSPEGGQAREVAQVNGSSVFGANVVGGLAWAADSQSLLYAWGGALWRVPVGGGKPEELPFGQNTQTPAVAHTGNRLAYFQANLPNNIWRLELTKPTEVAGPPTRIISSTRGEQDPQVSPDGKHIAFESQRSGNMEIWVCDEDGSNPVQVTSFGGPVTERPHWSPDSRSIVFHSRASGNTELYMVNMDGGQLHRFSTGTPNATYPVWARDGRWIYFATQGPGAIWKVPAEGGAAVQLTKEGRFDPMESVDGTRVFYVVDLYEGRKLTNQIWSVPADGGEERYETAMTTNASWGPARDGIYFIDDAVTGSPGRLTFYDFATRHSHKVAELPRAGFPGDLSVSRDGRIIFYAQTDEFAADIMLVEGFR